METSPVMIATPLMKPVSEPIMPTAITTEVRTSSVCPWSKIKAVESVSLNDVMSEQLAVCLTEEGNLSDVKDTPVFVDDFMGCGEDVTDCCDDYLLAKMLQLEFDKEYDNNLKREESKYNNGKVRISYEKYRRLPNESISSDEDDDKEYVLDQHAKEHYRNLEQAEKTFQAVGKSGVSRQGNVTTTKHDPTVCGRRNADKLMKLNPAISTGDAGMFDMKLSNNVFNTLKKHAVTEHKRSMKFNDKHVKHATAEKVLDEKTHLILYKLVSNQTLESLTGCFSTGKEACVYHAWGGLPEDESPSPEYAIKVFKTTLNEFQNRDQYIKDDYRFRHRFNKQNPTKVIHMWAEKEIRNLRRMKEANICCPDAILLKKHVLIMSFIGKDMIPAPKVKDVELPFEDMTIMYEQTVEIIRALYTKCKLVHADLSEYNLLWYDDKTWVIDVSQAVEITHPHAFDFLLRDCTNISSFFQKKGVLNVPNGQDLFFEICGKSPKESESAEEPK